MCTNITAGLLRKILIKGFFSGDESIPPNIGLTDQQSALRWVKENIAGREFSISLCMVSLFLLGGVLCLKCLLF